MVRPTIPMGLAYGAFDSTTNQTLSASNTATAITLDTTLSANGVSVGTPTSRMVVAKAGFYQIDVSVQFTSSSGSAKTLYFWLSKNGTDVPDTTRVYTIKANGDQRNISTTYMVSLVVDDYIELKWAATNTAVSLTAVSGLSFAPDVPAVLVSVTQIQL